MKKSLPIVAVIAAAYPRVTRTMPMPRALLALLMCTGCIALAPQAVTARQATGGSYSMTIDGGKPIALTSLDFGESNASTSRSGGKAKLSPVTVTTATGVEAMVRVISACLTGSHFNEVVATYKNAQGQVQFEVDFRMVFVSSITLPAVDKTASPPADMTWVLVVGTEEIKSASPAGGKPGALAGASPAVLQRVWRSNVMRPAAAPTGKFSLTLAGLDTSGVLTVSPFVLNTPIDAGTGRSSAGKVTLSPINLTVDGTKAQEFNTLCSTAKVVPNGTLVYNRRNDAGQQESLELDLKLLIAKSCNLAGNAGSAPVLNVQFAYDRFSVVSR